MNIGKVLEHMRAQGRTNSLRMFIAGAGVSNAIVVDSIPDEIRMMMGRGREIRNLDYLSKLPVGQRLVFTPSAVLQVIDAVMRLSGVGVGKQEVEKENLALE